MWFYEYHVIYMVEFQWLNMEGDSDMLMTLTGNRDRFVRLGCILFRYHQLPLSLSADQQRRHQRCMNLYQKDSLAGWLILLPHELWCCNLLLFCVCWEEEVDLSWAWHTHGDCTWHVDIDVSLTQFDHWSQEHSSTPINNCPFVCICICSIWCCRY